MLVPVQLISRSPPTRFGAVYWLLRYAVASPSSLYEITLESQAFSRCARFDSVVAQVQTFISSRSSLVQVSA